MPLLYKVWVLAIPNYLGLQTSASHNTQHRVLTKGAETQARIGLRLPIVLTLLALIGYSEYKNIYLKYNLVINKDILLH